MILGYIWVFAEFAKFLNFLFERFEDLLRELTFKNFHGMSLFWAFVFDLHNLALFPCRNRLDDFVVIK